MPRKKESIGIKMFRIYYDDTEGKKDYKTMSAVSEKIVTEKFETKYPELKITNIKQFG